MSLNKEDIDLIDRHFDRQLDQYEEETFDVKYLTSELFKDEVDLRKNLIKNVEAFREDDLRKQFTAHMQVIDEKKKERAQIRKKSLVAASFLLILSSIGIYMSSSNTKGPQALFDEYYVAYDGIVLSRNQSDRVSEGRMQYLNGNYEAALAPLVNLESHKNADLLMIGICYLEMDQPEHALNWFSKIEANATQDIQSVRDWYIALSYLKNGKLTACEEILRGKTISDSIYSKRAKALLNERLFDE